MNIFEFLKKKPSTKSGLPSKDMGGAVSHDPEIWIYEPELSPSAIKSVLDSGCNIDIQNMIDLFLRIDPDFLGKYQDRLSVSRKVKVSWIPASEDQADIDFCEEVKAVLNPLLTNKVIKHHLKSNFRRFALSEIVWKPEGGRIVPVEIKSLPVRAFALSTESYFEEDRRHMRVMLFDSNSGAYSDIPPFKTIQTLSQFELDHSIISLGEALARIIVIKFYTLHKQWTRFNELFAIPPTIVSADDNISDADFLALQTAVEDMGSNLKGVLKGATELVFPQPGDGSPTKFLTMLQACKDAIYLAIIGQPATSSSGKDATHASMKVLYGIREDIITDDLDMVGDAFNEDLVKPYVFLNFGDRPLPRVELLVPSQTSDLMDNDKKLKDLGVKFNKSYFVKRYDLNEEDFEIQETADPASPPVMATLSPAIDSDLSPADIYKIRMLKEWETATDFLTPDITHKLDPLS